MLVAAAAVSVLAVELGPVAEPQQPLVDLVRLVSEVELALDHEARADLDWFLLG